MRKFFFVTICFALLCSFSFEANANKRLGDELLPTKRADPGYMQQLEKRSMLGDAVGIAKIVSGSELGWQVPAGLDTADMLLSRADTMLYLHPYTVLSETGKSLFTHLSSSNVLSIVRDSGFSGVYISPLGVAGDQWITDYKSLKTGEDVVQFEFSEIAGSSSQYKTLFNRLNENQKIIGSDIIPGATGIGPDFFLAARAYRDYPGLYSMVELPQEVWKELPLEGKEFMLLKIPQSTVEYLSQKGLLPPALLYDQSSKQNITGGWAVTGKVMGIDGKHRRWAYRYYSTPHRPTLNWEDPSQAALRVLSSSAARQVGLLGEVLIGMDFEALQGLDLVLKNSASASNALEPALTAAQVVNRQIRRYGGWGWLKSTNINIPDSKNFLAANVDFIQDTSLSPAVEHTLLSHDASLLRFMLNELINSEIESKRLVHSTPSQGGINYTLPQLNYLKKENNALAGSLLDKTIDQAHSLSNNLGLIFYNSQLQTTSTGLAAAAARIHFDDINDNNIDKIKKPHLLFLHFKSVLPGILLIAGQDLVGALPIRTQQVSSEVVPDAKEAVTWGGYSLSYLTQNTFATRVGMPTTRILYGPVDEQIHLKESFASHIRNLVDTRVKHEFSKGQIVAQLNPQNSSIATMVVALPQNKVAITVANFSDKSYSENLSLQALPFHTSLSKAQVVIGKSQNLAYSGSHIKVKLAPWEAVTVIFSTSTKIKKVGNSAQTNLFPTGSTSMTQAIKPEPITSYPPSKTQKKKETSPQQEKSVVENKSSMESISKQEESKKDLSVASPARVTNTREASQTKALTTASKVKEATKTSSETPIPVTEKKDTKNTSVTVETEKKKTPPKKTIIRFSTPEEQVVLPDEIATTSSENQLPNSNTTNTAPVSQQSTVEKELFQPDKNIVPPQVKEQEKEEIQQINNTGEVVPPVKQEDNTSQNKEKKDEKTGENHLDLDKQTKAPSTPTDVPSTPAEAPSTPTDVPSTPAEAPSTPTDGPSKQIEGLSTPTDIPSTQEEKKEKAKQKIEEKKTKESPFGVTL